MAKSSYSGKSGAKWMQKAFTKAGKGKLTKKAKASGMSPMAYARKHYHDKGKTGLQSRAAVNAQKSRKKR